MEDPHEAQQVHLLDRIARSVRTLHQVMAEMNGELESVRATEPDVAFVARVLQRWTRGVCAERCRREVLEPTAETNDDDTR